MRALSLLLLIAACRGGEDPVPPGCGDGLLDADEQCDDGTANADTPGACRATCLLPRCGDAIADPGEDCDDGNGVGGDGCRPDCVAEAGPAEEEPNDAWDEAQLLTGTAVDGALPEGDVDCFAVEVPTCGAVGARVVDCPADVTLDLHDPDGVLVASGGSDAEGCAALHPEDEPGARFVQGGAWAVCLTGFLGAPLPAYRLELDVVDDAATLGAAYKHDDDIDGDGLPTWCDPDRDGDGVLDVDDNCPDVSNGPDTPPLATRADGWLADWLVIGAFTGEPTTGACRPSDTESLGDDAAARPALGDGVDGLWWRVMSFDGNRVDFVGTWGSEPTPREVYAAVYLRSDTARDLTLSLGPDDGARAWLNGEEVLDISGCQGTRPDQFTAPVSLIAGWNALLVKVRDQGGGWGMYARLKDGDLGVTDLEVSLDPGGTWSPGQSDLDGDGVGDACDDTPAG